MKTTVTIVIDKDGSISKNENAQNDLYHEKK